LVELNYTLLSLTIIGSIFAGIVSSLIVQMIIKKVEKNSITCDKCGISLNQRLYKNKRIALSTNSRINSGFLCIHCVLHCKNKPTIYRTIEQVNQFLKENIEEFNLILKKKFDYQKKLKLQSKKYHKEHKEEAKNYRKKYNKKNKFYKINFVKGKRKEFLFRVVSH